MLANLSLLFILPAAFLLWVPMLAIINGVYTGDQALLGVLGLLFAAPGVLLVAIDLWRNGWKKSLPGFIGIGLLASPFVTILSAGGACELTQSCGDLLTPPALRTIHSAKSSELSWTEGTLIEDMQSAWVVGGRDKRGLYVTRSRLKGGARVPPHAYPKERIVSVVSGVLYAGSGDEFDEAKLIRYEAADIFRIPAGTMHFFSAPEGDVVFDEHGIGPAPLASSPDIEESE